MHLVVLACRYALAAACCSGQGLSASSVPQLRSSGHGPNTAQAGCCRRLHASRSATGAQGRPMVDVVKPHILAILFEVFLYMCELKTSHTCPLSLIKMDRHQSKDWKSKQFPGSCLQSFDHAHRLKGWQVASGCAILCREEQLQLDVRYLTRPEDGEGGPWYSEGLTGGCMAGCQQHAGRAEAACVWCCLEFFGLDS